MIVFLSTPVLLNIFKCYINGSSMIMDSEADWKTLVPDQLASAEAS